jgi:carbonic anhydrase
VLHQAIDEEFARHEEWVLRRQKGIPNNRRLFVLACMDERIPVEEVLGIRLGDAHVFRNAGGVVTDDVIRSAALTTNLFGTKEIIVINHTECGMMSASAQVVAQAISEKAGVDLGEVPIDPAVPEVRLRDGSFARWLRCFDDVDDNVAAQVELLRSHPLIPKDVVIHGYVYEVDTGRLRPHHRVLARKVNTAKEMAAVR